VEIVDEYLTLSKASKETLFKEKGSKFFGYAFPVESEEEVKELLVGIKKQHHSARHWCYAWKLGVENVRFRVNDDGEPSNSAGQPIYGQILSFDLTNVLIIVVRYFGGVKLGVGGLVKAYKTSAQITLESSEVIKKNIEEEIKLIFDYQHMNKIMRVIKQLNLSIQKQKMELNCEFDLSVKKSEIFKVKEVFQKMHFLKLK
jgi:uncharacterized YigZ family protein